MFGFLSQLSNFSLFLLLGCVFTFASLFSILIITRWLPRRRQPEDNAVIGSISAIVGVIYGVLVGLTALYLFNNIAYTTDAVRREANAVANIYRDSFWLKDSEKNFVQKTLNQYLHHTIEVEWPFMEKGKNVSQDGDVLIDQISRLLRTYSLTQKTEEFILPNILSNIENLFDARNERIEMSYSQLNPAVWLVVIIGSVLTLAINYFFVINFYLHFLSVAAIGLMVSSMIFLLVALDRPFQGEFSVKPLPFESVLSYVDKKAGTL